MGLATIDLHSQKFTKSPSLVLIGLVLTEIRAFQNEENLQRNVCVCISIHFFINVLLFEMPVSQSKLDRLASNLGILWISVCSFWLGGSIVANPIIYRLVPSPSRFKSGNYLFSVALSIVHLKHPFNKNLGTIKVVCSFTIATNMFIEYCCCFLSWNISVTTGVI